MAGAYSRLGLNSDYTLDQITAKLGRPTPITSGDYLTIIDQDDGIYYVLKVTAHVFKPVYPVFYKVIKVGRWATAIQSLIMFDHDI